MPVLEWDSSLETGNAVVDRQHKELIKMVNDLHQAIIAQKTNEVLFSTLEKLAEYTIEHFKTEEALMTSKHYPNFDRHKQRHDELAKQATQIIADYKDGKYTLSLALSSFLGNWVRHHIFQEDMEMVIFLRTHQ
jgi:hemerythrin